MPVRFKYPDGVVPDVLALAYVAFGHAGGVALLTMRSPLGALAGVLLVAHTLVIATYLLHECIHETLFTSRAAHARLGRLLTWITGGQWAGWESIRRKHLLHHVGRTDPTTFDVHAFVAGAPPWLRAALLGLEWLHLPAIDVVLRVELVLRPFLGARWRRERRRVAAALVAWTALAVAAAAVSPRAALLYLVAYTVFLVALRLFDAFHHTYDLVVVPDYEGPPVPAPGRDRAFEQAHTFSNVVLAGRPWSNLLVLNFAYHNAHHAKPGVPWHRLPGLDRRLYGPRPAHERTIAGRLRDFHRHRLARVLPSATADAGDGSDRGAIAVSLLTL